MTPREMAAFAYDNGYYTEDAGTKTITFPSSNACFILFSSRGSSSPTSPSFPTPSVQREAYKSQPIDLTQELQSGSVPLLMQWDKRWGYDAYGSNMIGLAGCPPCPFPEPGPGKPPGLFRL